MRLELLPRSWNGYVGFGHKARYTCGRYAKFKPANSSDLYEGVTLTCQWNKG